MSALGIIVRGDNCGDWRTSARRGTGSTTGSAPVPVVDIETGHDELVRRWLRTFGPGTDRDQVVAGIDAERGSPVARRAGAVEVDLDGERGYVLPDDVDPEPPVEPWAALLPVLDPTTMGWQERS